MKSKWSFNGLPAFLAALGAGVLISYGSALAQGDVTAETGYRRIVQPGAYGTIIMERNTKGNTSVAPVLFPHWAHRTKYACSVCHATLGFPMKAGESDIKQADIEAGKSCGECHNGKVSFAASECNRCHSYGAPSSANRSIEDATKGLPEDHFGNKVDWAAAEREGKIKPDASFGGGKALKSLDLEVTIPVTKFKPAPPDVVFPHKAHTAVMECSACHESIFKQKAGANPDMNMLKIMSGQYCGVCHGRVAFPLGDCFRCHSKPITIPKEDEEKADNKDKKDGEK